MRLHNRQVKSTFWTDTDLLRNFNIAGRMFYQGLWQLADDSGCLEDDCFAFKIHLFPADSEIDLDTIKDMRDKLVEMGKIIPYESADGKPCLFLKNFHKHQTLRSPAPPEVPLPSWVTWVPSDKARRSGKYVVCEPYGDQTENLTQPYGHLTVTETKPYGDQPEPEPEKEYDDVNNNNARTRAKQNIYQKFEQEIGRPLSPMEVEQVNTWLKDGLPVELIIEALKKAVLQQKVTMKYIDSILRDWTKKNVRTLAEVRRLDDEFEQRKRAGPGKTVKTDNVHPLPRGGNRNKDQPTGTGYFDDPKIEEMLRF